MVVKIDNLKTEARNDKTINLDMMSTQEIIRVMNEEDIKVVEAVKEGLPQIEKIIKAVIEALPDGGRLIYMGAGTSGRLGILDAVECVPTFSTTNEVEAMMAGGNEAFVKAKEGAEDDPQLAQEDLKKLNLTNKDVVVAIAASGRTPYCIGALDYSKQIGAKACSIACNKNAEMSKHADIAVEVDAGPEILTGSTRLKSGTCQKIILNMISTASMVGIGKVYGNLMVDMKATNQKLVERSKRMVMQATGCDYDRAQQVLDECEYNIKQAIVMIKANVDRQEAIKRLDESKGFVRKAIGG